MKFGRKFLVATAILGTAYIAIQAQPASGFGGEDMIEGDPWHHYDIAYRALKWSPLNHLVTNVGNLSSEVSLARTNGGEADSEPNEIRDMTAPVAAATPAASTNQPTPKANPALSNLATFSDPAATAVAWHADYIDSYLYNPLWWAQDFPSGRRFKASIRSYEELAKVHHDDTFSSQGLEDNWTRYQAGAVLALMWLAREGGDDSIAAAHQVLGVAAHANADFYSHSNWVDAPERRTKTWYERELPQLAAKGGPNFSRLVQTRAQALTGSMLYSGAYEKSENAGVHHHGAYSLSCSAINGTGVSSALSTLCSGVSPFTGFPMCTQYRVCQSATRVNLSAMGQDASGLVYLQPTGMALDSRNVAAVGTAHRGITDEAGAFKPGMETPNQMTPESCAQILNLGNRCTMDAYTHSCRNVNPNFKRCTTDSQQIFAVAKSLAIESTQKMMSHIQATMRNIDPARDDQFETFWNNVRRNGSDLGARTNQFEDYTKVAYQFMTAGPYPILNAASPRNPRHLTSNGWYLRLRIRTGTDEGAGTDADIRLRAGGREYLLDYLPTSDAQARVSSPFLVYNDFENGDNDVYTIGPFDDRPTDITLVNGDADTGDVAEALWDDFVNTLDHGLTDLRRLAMSIFGGNADFVGTARLAETASVFMEKTGGRPTPGYLEVNGGSEGLYRLHYIRESSPQSLSFAQRVAGWKAVRLTMRELECVRESTVDQGSSDDEPFFSMTVAALNGLFDNQLESQQFGPYSDLDSNERVGLNNHTFTVKFPPEGGYALSIELMESDNENAFDREQIMETFVAGQSESVRRGNGKFLSAMGRYLGAAWQVGDIEVTPFYRASRPELGPTQTFSDIGWIEGGQSTTRDLSDEPTLKAIRLGSIPVANWRDETSAMIGRRLGAGELASDVQLTPRGQSPDEPSSPPNLSQTVSGRERALSSEIIPPPEQRVPLGDAVQPPAQPPPPIRAFKRVIPKKE
jgi:hypothetical protein